MLVFVNFAQLLLHKHPHLMGVGILFAPPEDCQASSGGANGYFCLFFDGF
jgi:hypothetical protein